MVRTPKQAAKDLALYLAITAAVFIPVVGSLITEWHTDAILKIVGTCFYTGMIFGPFVYKAHQHWRQPRFWFGTLTLFAMHCGVLIFLSKQEHITFWLITPIIAIEMGTLNLWADDLAKPNQTSPSQSPHN